MVDLNLPVYQQIIGMGSVENKFRIMKPRSTLYFFRMHTIKWVITLRKGKSEMRGAP